MMMAPPEHPFAVTKDVGGMVMFPFTSSVTSEPFFGQLWLALMPEPALKTKLPVTLMVMSAVVVMTVFGAIVRGPVSNVPPATVEDVSTVHGAGDTGQPCSVVARAVVAALSTSSAAAKARTPGHRVRFMRAPPAKGRAGAPFQRDAPVFMVGRAHAP